MGLTPTVGPEWIADSGATYHTTPDPGILSSVHPPSSHPSSIMVANDSCLPVTSVGATGAHGSFRLPDILVAPSMVHNLLSIRRFTADNSCSVEFDSSGLTVKDLASSVLSSDVIARGLFTPFASRRLLHLHLLRRPFCQLLSQPLLSPLLGTGASAILDVMP